MTFIHSPSAVNTMAERFETWYRGGCELSRIANSTQTANIGQALFSRIVNKEKTPRFGDRLREAFDGASNTEIAGLLGYKSKSPITKFMKGALPNGKVLKKISQITNCNLNWLLNGVGPKKAPVGEEERRDAVEVIALDEVQRIFIKKLVEFRGGNFKSMLKKIIYSGLDQEARAFSIAYRSMRTEQLEDVLDAYFSNIEDAKKTLEDNGPAQKRA